MSMIDRKLLLTLLASVATAVGSAVGYIEIAAPGRMIAKVDPAELQRIARPDAFTSADGKELEERLDKVESEVTLLREMVTQMLIEGPKRVRENQERILSVLEQMRQTQETMRREQEKHFAYERRPQPQPRYYR